MLGVRWVPGLPFVWLQWVGKDLELLEQERAERKTDLSVWDEFKGLLRPCSWLSVRLLLVNHFLE